MDDAYELVHQLCTRAGMIMEDVNGVALAKGTQADVNDRVDQIRQAGLDIGILAEAASVILRRANS